MNIGQIPELPMNPRQWTQDQIDKLAESIKETPELFEARPLLVVPHEGKYVILGGNMRFEASRKNKAEEIPAIVFPEDTPIDKMKEIVIKDNGSFGDWDYDALANEWDDLDLGDWGVPAWKVPNYAPNLTPDDGVAPVTDDDVKRAADHLGDALEPAEKEIIEVTCPHCGKKFTIRV